MTDWARLALDRIAGGEPSALVTLLAVEGSTPREAGTKMLVWPGGQAGTIGGGNLEHLASDQARRMLGGCARFAVQDYPLGPLLAQCCGGRVRLLIERLDGADADWLAEAARCRDANQSFEIHTRIVGHGLQKQVAPVLDPATDGPPVRVNGDPARAREARPMAGDEIVEVEAAFAPGVQVFGAGHVGQAIVRALAPLPFQVAWYDSREEMAGLPGVTVLEPDVLAEIVGAGGDYTLIVTHDHALDYAFVSAALAGPGTGYLGLIGSRTKRARFFSRLRADGFSDETLARLTCPIGIPELHDKAPEVIAVSVATDLLLRLQASRRLKSEEAALASL